MSSGAGRGAGKGGTEEPGAGQGAGQFGTAAELGTNRDQKEAKV